MLLSHDVTPRAGVSEKQQRAGTVAIRPWLQGGSFRLLKSRRSGRVHRVPPPFQAYFRSGGPNPTDRLFFGSDAVIKARMASNTTLNCASCFFSSAASFQARSAFEASIRRRCTKARMISTLTRTARGPHVFRRPPPSRHTCLCGVPETPLRLARLPSLPAATCEGVDVVQRASVPLLHNPEVLSHVTLDAIKLRFSPGASELTHAPPSSWHHRSSRIGQD
jgi:hypothetical protein